MKTFHKIKNNHLYFTINTFFLFQLLNSVFSQTLNNIIRLANKDFRYSHFSFTSNEDMIIDTSSYPINKERKFFGLTNNGQFYFTLDNQKTSYYSITMNHDKGRIEGESCLVKLTSSNINLHGKELIYGISKKGDSNEGIYVEIYNLEDKNYTSYPASIILGNVATDSFTLIKTPDDTDSKFYYTLTYIVTGTGANANKYFLNIRKTYFTFDINAGFQHVKQDSFHVSNQKMVSCFYTKNKIYICFYLGLNNYLMIKAYDFDFTDSVDYEVYKPSSYGVRLFFKGIHLKDEIGFFIYFKINAQYPTISILQCDDNKNMNTYNNFRDINVGKTIFNTDIILNDLIKLNNFQVCYISISTDKNHFKFVTFTLYKNDELMNIRYYQIEMFAKYRMKIYLNLKASLYKNFISLTFSHCPQSECTSSTHLHYASLIIFSYPNSTDSSLDIIPILYTTNRKIENDFSFNFEGQLTIENNLFGFVFKGTRIMKYISGLSLTNITNGNILEPETLILKDENISLYFNTHTNYEQENYIIEYAYVLEEPKYEDLNNYYNNYDYSFGNNNDDEQNYYRQNEYTGKSSNFSIIISNDLKTDCNSDICSLCFTNYTCITCIYNYTFNNNEKKCLPNPINSPTTIPTTILTTIPTTIPTTIINKIPNTIPTTILILTTIPKNNNIQTTYPHLNYPIITTTIPNIPSTNKQDCTDEEILKGNCKGRMTNEQIGEIYNKLKNSISADSNDIIETENVIFQITTLEEQKNSNNPNVSSIDLGECEKLIKEKEGLSENDNLIVLKTDIKNDDLSSTYVQYEIYNPNTLNKISLDICGDLPISVSVPINLDENTKSIYDSLSQSGYNLFNLNDSFYNDICTTFTTENGTDLTLAERKNLIYDNKANISLCQDGCTFQSYNITTKKAKCDCSVQSVETITDLNKINFDKKELANNFFSTLKNSNFLVLKCYKLVFSKKGQINNIGSYLMSGVNSIFIILMFFYIISGNKKIYFYIQNILKFKLNYKNKPANKLFKTEKANNNNSTKNFKKYKFRKKGLKVKKNKKIKKKNYLKKGNHNTNFPPKRKVKTSNISNYKQSYDDFASIAQEKTKSRNNLLELKNKGKIQLKKNNYSKYKIQSTINEKNNISSMRMYLEKYKIKELNDQELNNLEYEIAMVVDKRTYFQYYFALLKKKQLILFAFCPANDYNLIAVKVSLLLLSFSLYFTINGFFFSDETMNKINKDKGEYDILFQIPQILYSTVISSIINIILKKLSLSEQQILAIKMEKDYLVAQRKSNKIKNCLKLKLYIFFILSFIFMVFFWYFISCFCAVYKNTQIILIKDTLISFAISMLYPFGLNLFPGCFRIPALRSPKKDKKCLYKASGLIALI